MKIAICDDEKIFRDHLKNYLVKYYRSLDDSIETFPSGELFLEAYKKNPQAFELIFMDIEMKQLDGISTAKQLRAYNRDVMLIFLTSHVEFALDGYEVGAFRFLAKPVNEKKLVGALQDMQYEMDQNKRLLIKDFDKEIFIKYKEIVSIEAQNVNVNIKTISNSYVIRKSLQQVEEELKGPMFYKSHRSYLINLGYVMDCNNKLITMENGEQIPLSRNKLVELKEALKLYVKTCR